MHLACSLWRTKYLHHILDYIVTKNDVRNVVAFTICVPRMGCLEYVRSTNADINLPYLPFEFVVTTRQNAVE